MSQQAWLWIIFSSVAAGMMAVDLGLFQRKGHAVRPREAAIWSGVWVGVALIVGLAVLFMEGRQKGLEFLTGYLIELSLSVDNIFVFVLIFAYFGVPAAYQHRVLFWGIVGAVILRGAFIFGGIVLLSLFHWLIYVLGALLIWGGIQLIRQDKVGVHPEKNRLLRLFQRVVPMVHDYDGQRFFTRREGRLLATPLMAVLLVIETTDLVFALDSIPAILAITRDPFIVFASNICAILGLRSLYFLFAALVDRLRYPSLRPCRRPLLRRTEDDLREVRRSPHLALAPLRRGRPGDSRSIASLAIPPKPAPPRTDARPEEAP